MIGVTDVASSAVLPPGNTSPVWRRAWHPVAVAAEVTGETPAQVLVAGQAWVLARLDGRLVAFEDQCPHQRSPLSAGSVTRAADGTARLTCAFHGWQFDATGRCDLIPPPEGRDRWGWERWRTRRAGRRAMLCAAYGVAEAYGLIWLAPREPLATLPAFPEWNAPGMTGACAPAVRTHASAGRLIERFLDGTHCPVSHAPHVPDTPDTPDAPEVSSDAWRLTGVFAAPEQAEPLRVTKTAGVSGTAHARLELPHATIGILLACQPEDWTTTRVFTLIAYGGTGGGTPGVSPEIVSTDIVSPDIVSTAWHRLMARALAACPAQ